MGSTSGTGDKGGTSGLLTPELESETACSAGGAEGQRRKRERACDVSVTAERPPPATRRGAPRRVGRGAHCSGLCRVQKTPRPKPCSGAT
mmetsp:Transcript_112748/g.318694  ORF Transcript_112748/g.318694 Transcript_112748/m.318694 type:complete len:90 (-) Transcript_112748:2-271(-)